MALVYRGHFALVGKPIYTSKGVNTSALYVFTQTLLDILNNRQPTHMAVAFDTEAPTQRHKDFAEYKIQREAMPEDISQALPHVRRMIDAFNIPVLTCDGYEADDIIGTLTCKAVKEGFETYMVTPDKDFGQLVSEKTFLFKPSRMGDAVEILGPPQILAKWGVQRTEQVIDILALWGDATDNIPGVPGIGEKTASKLIGQYGSVENLLAHTSELKGKLKEALETNREQAMLSKRLATIICDVPCDVDLERLKVQPPNADKLKALFVEFEFNSIGRRLFGDDFKAGRGYPSATGASQIGEAKSAVPTVENAVEELSLFPAEGETDMAEQKPPVSAELKTLSDVPHEYHVADTPEQRAELIRTLQSLASFCFGVTATGSDVKDARLTGLTFSFQEHTGWVVPIPPDHEKAKSILEEFRPIFEAGQIAKVGHNLKFDLSVLKWNGVSVQGRIFDTMIAHSLIEPDMRHSARFLSETFLGYSLIPEEKLIGESTSAGMPDVATGALAEAAAEKADVILQLRAALEPLLKQRRQERVFYEIEAPLIPVLADMEFEGIRLDARSLAEFDRQISRQIVEKEKAICHLAGKEFNLNSPRQLGEVLFDVLKICAEPKKTKTGQYATDEQTLLALAPDHEIVRHLLEHRVLSKLKSTYVDTLPGAIWPRTGRVHTTYHQTATSTGRLNSQNPNLQNIPIRTEQGREIRKAFVPRDENYLLLSADYSQIELRIIAALSKETAMIEALTAGIDIHTATAARVYGISLDLVTSEMRRKAKMVNYGIAYGISAFGLAQRLGIPRKEAAAIMDQYFTQFPGIRKYMSDTIALARQLGYVETITGRRRYIRDIRSSNATLRGAAERNAINAPIQGTAADMIKMAMTNIHQALGERKLKTRMLLQVHDELVFDLCKSEQGEVLPLVEEKMKTALPLEVPIVVEMGLGENWLEAH